MADMKLLRKDLHEITAGAARACEQNELLRQEAAMLRLCLEENGVEAPQTLLDARFQQQPDSPFASALPSVASSPRAPLSSKAGEAKKEAKKEAPERAVPGLKLAPRPQESAASAHPSLALAPIIHEIDSCLFSLRQNCSTIIQDTEEVCTLPHSTPPPAPLRSSWLLLPLPTLAGLRLPVLACAAGL